jgi:phosphoglycerate dehydrogenase-like enzyme
MKFSRNISILNGLTSLTGKMHRPTKLRSIYLLDPVAKGLIYSDAAVRAISMLTSNTGENFTAEDIMGRADAFSDVAIVFSGWGCPELGERLLSALPGLRAVFYGAGSVRSLLTAAFWERDILLTSSYRANAIPVAEYTVASVIFALKGAWQVNQRIRQGDPYANEARGAGAYKGSRVGVISLGAIGQLVCQKLRQAEVDVMAYDPVASPRLFEEFDVARAQTLKEIFSRCEVVTLHAPLLPQTERMITGSLLASMPRGGVFINTSRGNIIDEESMIQVLGERPDLFAVLDVLADESDYGASALARMPNVFLTSHLAGSIGRECFRMGDMAVEECRRYLGRESALAPVTRQAAQFMA